ncbi:MAG: DUF4982 domain-containing protein [Firmicutes bacterium]|nr:DUF4982 domain-containing protein [Bacillota bacterium]
MEKIKLIEGWRMFSAEEPESLSEIPEDTEEIRLPHDALPKTVKDYSIPNGAETGYYPTVVSHFFRVLPKADAGHCIYLEVEGVLGFADIFIDGAYIAHTARRERTLIDITQNYKAGALLCLRIATHPDTGKYIGNGIAGGVSLLSVRYPLSIAPYGGRIHMHTPGEKAAGTAYIEIQSAAQEVQSGELLMEIFNEKQRRVVKKLRQVKLAAGSKKIIEIPFRILRAFEWTRDDPYLYTCRLTLTPASAQSPAPPQTFTFGIAKHELANRAYRLNGKAEKLKGAVLAHDNGMSGAASDAAAEYRKLSALKEIGYNAVRYIGVPTETALDCLDRLGMLCVTDIFDKLECGARSLDGRARFGYEWEAAAEAAVRTLRNHPCVAFYSVANDAEESYGRGKGYALIKKITAKIKEFNPAALITANAFERVPLKCEAERFEIKQKSNLTAAHAIAAAREKDLFTKITEPYFEGLDVAGYSFLYPDLARHSAGGRFVLGLADRGDKAFEALEAVESNPGVLGCFLNYGADFAGSAAADGGGHIAHKPYINTQGDLDSTLRRKSASYHKEILLGKRNVCAIVVQDPDFADPAGLDHFSETYPLWNWPRHVGKPIKIVVYAGGDIIQLNLDGKSVGRKLAGRQSNFTAVFKTNFYPGKLEAISYYKGSENAKCELESVLQPKAIKLECAKKQIFAGESCYIDMAVTDKEGRIVPYATRELQVSVSAEGELTALGTADPLGTFIGASTVRVYDGRATALVRGNVPGRLIVKVSGEGLLSNKMTIKVK